VPAESINSLYQTELIRGPTGDRGAASATSNSPLSGVLRHSIQRLYGYLNGI